ncbi:adhesion G-protein coupled receptor G4-like [Acanthaster planci]|uniref:Adhesion G-protein coupled receptor G4-like n=1 Tax=Acanthaster planci TaxID=133434 RepID=A0A8B7XS81_ACAPL|nr:adhesion G-protein coupled receptor G4-like [Acanthaster planci]
MYKGRDRSGNENVCQFSVTVVGQCASETVDGLTWPVTSAGSMVESIQRCLLMTTNAGEPLAVRNCSVVQPPVYFQWEEPEHRSCGKERTDVTIEDVVKVEVSTGNAVEVAGFLANETSESTSGDAQDVEVVSGILMNIIQAQSGDSEVTELVLEAVNNVIRAGVEADTPDSRRSSSEIVRSVEKQVALTLQEEGRVSIRQETVHVEAVSLDPEENRDGFSFASVRKPGPGTTEKGSLVGTAVQTFGDDIPADIDVVASVQLPRGILDSLPTIEANNSTLLQVSFLIYADDTLFHSSSIRRHQEETNSTRKVAGPVVSLTVENVKLVNLTEPLVVTFKAPDEEFVAGVTTTQCVFWDFDLEDGIGDWSTVGCTRSGLSSEVVSCECNHATNFAILMDVKGQQIMNRALDIISQVGCALSIAALVTTLIIYLSIRKLRTGKSRQIFIHFCFSLLMLYIVFLAGVDNAKGGACVFVSALLHYLTLSTMMWMAVEARNVYVHTVRVFPEDTPRYMIKACLIAWGFPLLVLTVTLATAVHHYDNELYCFLKPDLVLYIALLAPIALILAHNFITFILVMRSLLKVREVSRSQQISKRLQNAVGISVLVGLTWAFGFLAINKATFVFQLIFCLANSLQGVVVCIMFCIRRDEVRTTVAPYIRRLCCCNAPVRPGREQRYHLPGVSQSAASPSVSKV